MGFNLGHWLVGAGKAIGKEFDHLATGAIDIGKAVVNQPVALAHELSGAVQGVAQSAVGLGHEASGAIQGTAQALTMPLMIGGLALGAFMLTQRR